MSEVNPNLPVAPPLAVSPGEAARLLGVSRRTLTRLIQQDKVKAKKLGRRTLIDAQGLRRFFEGLCRDRRPGAAVRLCRCAG